jgi:hypothetical protein
MSSKIKIGAIWDAQLNSFLGYTAGGQFADALTFVVVPIIAGIAAAFWAPPVYAVGSILSGVSVFAALLVALLVNIFNFSVKIRRDEKLRPEESLSLTVDELIANAAWAVVVGLFLVVLLVAAASTQIPSCPLNKIWTGVLSAVFLHLMACVLMVLSRIWTAHEQIRDLPPKD